MQVTTPKGSNGQPMYGSQNSSKNMFSQTPCGCGSHSFRVDTGECSACYSRRTRFNSFSGVKPLPNRQKLDRLLEEKALEKELDSYAV